MKSKEGFRKALRRMDPIFWFAYISACIRIIANGREESLWHRMVRKTQSWLGSLVALLERGFWIWSICMDAETCMSVKRKWNEWTPWYSKYGRGCVYNVSVTSFFIQILWWVRWEESVICHEKHVEILVTDC